MDLPSLDATTILIIKWMTTVFGSGVTGTVNILISSVVSGFLLIRFGGAIRDYNRRQNEARRDSAQANNPVENHRSEEQHKAAEDEIEDILKGTK